MYRISEFLERILSERGISPNAFKWIAGEDVPLPYRDLLVHDRDMTSTLADFHRSALGLDVLNMSHDQGEYAREVILFAKDTRVPVEYGAIDLILDHFKPEEQEAIIEGNEPLGSILNRLEYPYRSHPNGFFSIKAPAVCREQFGCSEDVKLYGRYNKLMNAEGRVLALIVEILPEIKLGNL
ncbi:MAG: hypothetical protein P8L49_08935 [Opitutaceae bacterium]|nr:hypothetical protein [Opitutaceae bacterium]